VSKANHGGGQQTGHFTVAAASFDEQPRASPETRRAVAAGGAQAVAGHTKAGAGGNDCAPSAGRTAGLLQFLAPLVIKAFDAALPF